MFFACKCVRPILSVKYGLKGFYILKHWFKAKKGKLIRYTIFISQDREPGPIRPRVRPASFHLTSDLIGLMGYKFSTIHFVLKKKVAKNWLFGFFFTLSNTFIKSAMVGNSNLVSLILANLIFRYYCAFSIWTFFKFCLQVCTDRP